MRLSKKILVPGVLALIMLTGLTVRLHGLDQVVLWIDESLTLMHMSGQSFPESITREVEASLNGPLNWQQLIERYQKSGNSLARVNEVLADDQPHHSPIFYDSMFLWAKAFGEDLVVLRLLPVLFGVVAIPAFYWMALELFRSDRIALIGAAFLSLSPLNICYSQELREYSLFTLAFCLCCATFIRAWRVSGAVNWAVYLAITVFSIYSSILILYVVAAQIVFTSGVLVMNRYKRGRFARASINKWLIHLITIAVTTGISFPILLNLFLQWPEAWNSILWTQTRIPQTILIKSIAYTPLFAWTFQPEFIFRVWDPDFFFAYRWFHRTIFVIECIAVVLMLRKAKWQLGFLSSIYLVFALTSFIPDLLLGGKRTLVVRYILPIPTVAILPVAFLLDEFLKSKKVLQAVALSLIVFLFTCQLITVDKLSRSHVREGFACSTSEIAEFINCDPKAPLLADLHTFHWCFPYLLALGFKTDSASRPVAYVDKVVPNWVYHVDRAFVIHFDDSMREKYSGFIIEQVGPHNSSLVKIRPRKK